METVRRAGPGLLMMAPETHTELVELGTESHAAVLVPGDSIQYLGFYVPRSNNRQRINLPK